MSTAREVMHPTHYTQGSVECKEASKPHDPVMHPTHYTHGGIECIDAIQAALTPEEFCGFCKGNVMKYLWRSQHKGAKIQDEKKAQWYLNRMVENGRSVEDD